MDPKIVLADQRYELEEKYKRVRNVIKREFEREYREFMKSGLIKVTTGIRRSGKSFSTYLLLRNKKFAYANFDEKILLSTEPNEILAKLIEVYGNVDIFFFDEIQNMDGWELFVNKLHRAGHNVFITGSNSKMLSREQSDRLTGRHIDMEIYPFSFREYIQARKFKENTETTRGRALIKRKLEEYMNAGGFPEIVVEGENPRIYLRALFEDIIEKDIIYRYRIREESTFREIAYYLLANVGKFISYNKLKNIFNLGSEHTTKNFVDYLNEGYLFFTLTKFDPSFKRSVKSAKKVYTIDPGFMNLEFRFSKNVGHGIENVVAIELMRRKSYWHNGWEIYYWKDYQQREIDFVVKEGERIKECIQVTYASGKNEIERREIKALEKASEELRCKKKTVITWDYEEEGEIRYIPLWKWLLERE